MTTNLQNFQCQCGKEHSLPIKDIIISAEALKHLGAAPAKLGLGRRALLVADGNTYEISGRKAEQELNQQGIQVKLCLFPTTEKIIPDERALIKVLAEFNREIDFLVAVGSGTINDLVRYISSRVGRPYLSVPTAPSMDGYTSVVAPLIIGGFKKPHEATYPTGVYADPEVLKNAPGDMIAAGFGDLVGKFTSRADWKISQIINGEYYCESAVNLVQSAVDQTLANLEALAGCQTAAISSLTEGLSNAGIGMLWVGNSRPASGAEHLLAHFWEMKALLRGEFKHFHGSEVAVGTVVLAKIYQKILEINLNGLDLERLSSLGPDRGRWEAEVREVYGPLAGEVFKENAHRSFSKAERREQLEKIIKTADLWKEAVRSFLPTPDQIIAWLRKIGTPALPEDLGLNPAQVREGIIHCQRSRNRFTILEVADQLGCLEDIAAEIAG